MIASRRPFVLYFLLSVAIVGFILLFAPVPVVPQPPPPKVSSETTTSIAPKYKPKPDTIVPIQMHSEAEVLHFLDSVGRLNWRTLDDSVDWNGIPPEGKPFSKILKAREYSEFKKGFKQGWVSKELAHAIYPDVIFIGMEEPDLVPIRFYPFDSVSPFRYYAVQFYPDQSWACTLAFFEESKLVAIQDVEHKYGCTIDGFVDADGRQFIHFPRCISAGMGAAEFRDCYYLWQDHKLRPALEFLRLGSFRSGPRMYTFYTQPISYTPLELGIWYEFQFYNPDSLERGIPSQPTILHDSSSIVYTFDTLSNRYQSDWSKSKLSLPQMKSYFNVENELLFVQGHHRMLKRLLKGQDEINRKSVQFYLSETMDGNYPKGQAAKR